METLPTFCINLDRSVERWTRMERIFKKHAITNVIRWSASTPETLEEYEFDQGMTPYEKACALSHYRLWKYIVENNISRAFILEDDACFRHDWLKIFNIKLATLDQEDPHWHALFLNAFDWVLPLETWAMAFQQCLTGGYLISYEGASLLLRIAEKRLSVADAMTKSLQSLGHSYTYFPWLIIQLGQDSTLMNNYQADHQRVLMYLARVGYNINNYDDYESGDKILVS
jgi:GR25 family glycosyltransferase involved in LPS biosynthesis